MLVDDAKCFRRIIDCMVYPYKRALARVQVLETKLEVFKINVKLSRVLGILKFYYTINSETEKHISSFCDLGVTVLHVI